MDEASRTLVVFAHPALERARIGPVLVEAAKEAGACVRDLYELYPDFAVDAPVEQAALGACDRIVLQFPFYWYAAPALLKEWMDVVLTHGFAYGEAGHALAGKTLGCAVSTGGGALALQAQGADDRTADAWLFPLKQAAELCGMAWADPFIVHDAEMDRPGALARAGEDYARWLEALA